MREPITTRFAPSPTGFLHLGHLCHIAWVWGVSQRFRSTILFRLEDHDQIRCQQIFSDAIKQNLEHLGLMSDHVIEVPRQSSRQFRYNEILSQLKDKRLVYRCRCTRHHFLASSTSEGYGCPQQCIDSQNTIQDEPYVLRLRVPPFKAKFADLKLGPQTQTWDGRKDPVIRDLHGQFTYAFCVVIDDLDQNVNLIIRGVDLLEQTALQLAIRNCLVSKPVTPHYLHHPLVNDHSGRKLSKRDAAQAFCKTIQTSLDLVRFFANIGPSVNLLPPATDATSISWSTLIPQSIRWPGV